MAGLSLLFVKLVLHLWFGAQDKEYKRHSRGHRLLSSDDDGVHFRLDLLLREVRIWLSDIQENVKHWAELRIWKTKKAKFNEADQGDDWYL